MCRQALEAVRQRLAASGDCPLVLPACHGLWTAFSCFGGAEIPFCRLAKRQSILVTAAAAHAAYLAAERLRFPLAPRPSSLLEHPFAIFDSLQKEIRDIERDKASGVTIELLGNSVQKLIGCLKGEPLLTAAQVLAGWFDARACTHVPQNSANQAMAISATWVLRA